MDTQQTLPLSHNRALGARGEELAVEYLQGIGCRLLDRNWRSGRRGELDLVVREGGAVVAVEVKTRSGLGYGTPLEAVTAQKIERLRHLLHTWVREHRTRYAALRVDAIGIVLRPQEEPLIDHVRGIS